MLVLARKIYVAIKLGTGIQGLASEGEPRFVIKTFLYDSSFPGEGQYRDAFFGSLPNFLKKRKKIFIVANIVGHYGHCIEQIRACKDVQIRPIEAFVTLRDIGSSLWEVLSTRLRVQGPLSISGYDVSDILNAELLRTHNGISFYQFLHFGAARVLANRMRIESFLFTYENNPWERMCMLAVKSQSPQTILIGYQHTVVPHASANMFSSSLERGLLPMPDRIITVGEAPKDIMEKYGDYAGTRIEPGCGLRFEYLFQLPLSPRQNRGNILVALEGIFDVYHLVNYCLENLKEADEYTIRIRTHPVLPLDQLAGKLVRPLESVPHFGISTSKALKEDLEWADVVIYWGSTVAMEALCLGKPVIHYDMGSILNYDPLFQCSELKWVVSNQDDLGKTIREIFAMNDEDYAAKQRMAKDYMNRYFLPVTDERMKRFLTESNAQSTLHQASNR
jgi:surface carbohydrate biosynthesis protein (TIGR04326 family)